MKLIYPFFFFLFLSCCTNIEKQNEINIYRFEDILFNSNEDNIVANRQEWESQIGQFSDVYYSFLTRENDFTNLCVREKRFLSPLGRNIHQI